MSVHIKISDRGWILETMARQIASRFPYVTYDTLENKYAKIQYYMTYWTRIDRVSPREIAYFTHLESYPEAQERFFAAARSVDACVCMSKLYAEVLKAKNIESVEIIAPGVDLEFYDVKLRIGVVGRTYSSGRKGEALVAEVMDTPGIEWLFTGDGWPGPGLNPSNQEMPDFYRSLDYVLVPAQYEGGPMSAIEALACGVKVIAPPVGWIPELPHIPYSLNDAADLRRVLMELVADRRRTRSAVLERSWDAFTDRHDRLFRRLLAEVSEPFSQPATQPPRPKSILLLTHGLESLAKGGPSTRIPELNAGLRKLGYASRQDDFGAMPLDQADLYHLFNVAMADTAEPAMNGLATFKRPIVFSPIYLDNRCWSLWLKRIPEIFAMPRPIEQLEPALRLLPKEAQVLRGQPLSLSKALPASYHQGIARLLSRADHIIFLSELERRMLSDVTGADPAGTVIPNPVDAAFYSGGRPELFVNRFGVKDFVLCVGRIEPRKNQLLLAAALSGTGIPLVLVGEPFDERYLEMIKAVPDLQLLTTGRLPSRSELLASAYAAARVFCLAGWSEGAPISALEAGAAGCKMVLGTFSGEQEYFAGRAAFANPSDWFELRAIILAQYDKDWTSSDQAELSEFTASNYSIEQHTRKTADVYETLLSQTRESVRRSGPSGDAPTKICARRASTN